MITKLLTSRQIAKRWKMHPGSIANMRAQGKGPRFIKFGRKVLYRLSTIDAFEERQWARGRFLGV